jgi:hypothetical protein
MYTLDIFNLADPLSNNQRQHSEQKDEMNPRSRLYVDALSVLKFVPLRADVICPLQLFSQLRYRKVLIKSPLV